MKSAMFLLMREYADASCCPSATYINAELDFDEENWLSWFNNWISVAGYFEYEHCERFYDGKNLKHSLYPYEVLQSYSEFPDLSLYALSQLDYHGFVDWRDKDTDDEGEQFMFIGNEVTDDTLGEIARHNNDVESLVLLNADAISHPSPISGECLSGHRILEVEYRNDIKGLHKWFSENRIPKRILDYNPKHGDKHHRSQMISHSNRKAAQLECSMDEAIDLLQNAVGYDKDTALWYWDSKAQKHIYFENQKDNRMGFHGYHLSEGEENYDNISIEKLEEVLGKGYYRKK